MTEPNGNGDSSRVTTFQLYERINQMDRDNEVRHNQLRGDLRSVVQTVDMEVKPALEAHEEDIKGLKARFVTALTMLGGSIAAVAYLYSNTRGGA